MAATCTILDLGLKPYAEVLQLQETLFQKNILAKEQSKPTENTLLLCEHYPVYTLGKSGKRENILVSDEELNAEYYHVSRGGDVTFHGPGQLVVYPIFDIDTLDIGLAQFIFKLEEAVIETLRHYELKGERIENAAGIWLRKPDGADEKICAIGVRASRHVTMHGLAININTDLSYFNKIVPCGLQGKGVTSLSKELNREESIEHFKSVFIEKVTDVFDFTHTHSTVK
ncbi:MAG: lipoyl(octanoyl) transferase LipB [Chitinophagales bacterium]|nr:lipoyl(octanoyl) transferase LipB [Chitinophagales bacterium]